MTDASSACVVFNLETSPGSGCSDGPTCHPHEGLGWFWTWPCWLAELFSTKVLYWWVCAAYGAALFTSAQCNKCFSDSCMRLWEDTVLLWPAGKWPGDAYRCSWWDLGSSSSNWSLKWNDKSFSAYQVQYCSVFWFQLLTVGAYQANNTCDISVRLITIILSSYTDVRWFQMEYLSE